MPVSQRELEHLPEWSMGRNSPDDELMYLMNKYGQPLYAFLFTLVGDPDVAADCAQDTFVRAYLQLRERNPVTAPWLYRVARNRAMDEHRRRKREGGRRRHLDLLTELHEPSHPVSRDVRRALSELSLDDREVLYLYAVDGFTCDEIGQMLGARPEAIRMRISRARRRFRAAFGDGV